MVPFLLLLLLLQGLHVNAQFAELANLATTFLGPSLQGATGAASGASGLLGQFGQFYQLAQAGIGLAGTGVDVLNKASQGNWFPAAIEQASLMQKNIGAMGQGGGGLPAGLGGLGGALGALGGGLTGGGGGGNEIGEEFGKSFPAPNIEDYETDIDLKGTTKGGEALVPIKARTELPTTVSTSKPIPITLFPSEEDYKDNTPNPTIKGPAPKKKITITLPKTPDYFEAKSTDSESEIEFRTENRGDYEDIVNEINGPPKERKARSEKEKVINLPKLIEILSKNKMKDEEIAEIVAQIESNVKATGGEETSHKIDIDSSVKNISPDMFEKQQRIIAATRNLREHLAKEQQERDKLLLGPFPPPSATTSTPTTTVDPPPEPYTTEEPSTLPPVTYSRQPSTEEPSTLPPVTHNPRPRTVPSIPDPLPTAAPLTSHQTFPASIHPQPIAYPIQQPARQQTQYLVQSAQYNTVPNNLYSISGQAIPPVQIVHPNIGHVPLYPQQYAQNIPLSPVPQGPPLPSPQHLQQLQQPQQVRQLQQYQQPQQLQQLPTYYTYQNANAHTITRGTVQMPVSSMPLAHQQYRVEAAAPRANAPRQPAASRARMVRQGSDPRLAAAALRTTLAPRSASRKQRRLSTSQRSEGTSGRRRIVDGHRVNNTPLLAKAHSAPQHRINPPSPFATVAPRQFPVRMAKTQPITTPSPVRRTLTGRPVASAVSTSLNGQSQRPQRAVDVVVSSDSRRPPGVGSTLVTPFWIDSPFIQRFPTQSGEYRSKDDLLNAEINQAQQRIDAGQRRIRQLTPEEYRNRKNV